VVLWFFVCGVDVLGVERFDVGVVKIRIESLCF
jgi:hypothetical protein